jgi:hypothetical protein
MRPPRWSRSWKAPGSAGLTACELEDLLTERGREVQRQLLQDHLDLRAAREEQAAREHRALAAKWRIATGVIEGACRHLIGDRLDITGARWGLQGAETVLTLRAVISNGDFEDYWRYHLTREHQRLYPGTAQGQYTLGA